MGTKGRTVFGLVLIVVSFPMYFLMIWDALFLIPALTCGLTGTVLAVLGAMGLRTGESGSGRHM